MNDMILHTIQCSNLILFYCFIAGVYGFLFVPEGLFHFDFVDPPSPTGCLESAYCTSEVLFINISINHPNINDKINK